MKKKEREKENRWGGGKPALWLFLSLEDLTSAPTCVLSLCAFVLAYFLFIYFFKEMQYQYLKAQCVTFKRTDMEKNHQCVKM